MSFWAGFRLPNCPLCTAARGRRLCRLCVMNCSAVIDYAQVPLVEGLQSYISQRISPDATPRNWNAYNSKVKFEKGVNVMEAFTVLPDPQTNGGLLISCNPDSLKEVQALLHAKGLGAHINPIGKIIAQAEVPLLVK